jgi:hypothetical protein
MFYTTETGPPVPAGGWLQVEVCMKGGYLNQTGCSSKDFSP